MPEASIPGDRNPKNSFDDVVRELQEIKDNDEQYANDNTELLLQIDETIQKTSDASMSQRNVINNIMQYQTELFGKLSDFAEMNNKAMLDQAENLKKLSETPKEKKDDKKKDAPSGDVQSDLLKSQLETAKTSNSILDFLVKQADQAKRDKLADARQAGAAGGGTDVKKEAKKGGLIGGIFRAIGGAFSMIGGIFKAIAKVGLGFIKGMGALGAGIAAFFVGFAAIGSAMQFAESAGEGVVKVMKNFFDAFNGVGVEGLAAFGMIIGAGVITSKLGATDQIKLLTGMTALGAGISGFFTGLLLGDLVAKLGAAVGIDGSSIKTLMQNVFGAFDGIKGTATLFTILGLGTIIALGGKKGVEKDIMKGMTALGAGIVGFMTPFAVADGLTKLFEVDGEGIKKLMQNVFGAFDGVSTVLITGVMAIGAAIAKFKVDGKAMAKGMGALGLGTLAFMGVFAVADAVLKAALAGIEWGGGGDMLKAIGAVDASIMKSAIGSFVGAFEGVSISATAMGALFAGGVAVAKLNVGPGKLIKGMGSLAAGILAFSAVFTVADKILGFFLPNVEGGDPMAVDMSNVERVVGGTFKVLSSIDTVTLGAIILAGALIPMTFPIKMGLLGAGLAAFAGAAGGIASIFAELGVTGDDFVVLMTNIGKGVGGLLGGAFSESLTLLSDLDGMNLIKVGAGIAAIGAGLAVFAGGGLAASLAEGAKGVLGAMKNWFSGEDPKKDDPLDALGPLRPFGVLATQMPEGFADKLYAIGEGMGGIADAFVVFSEGKIKSGIGNIMGQKGSFDGFVDLLIKLSAKDINGEQIQKALEGFAIGMEKVGAAASQVKDLRSPGSPKSLGGPAGGKTEVTLTQDQANEIGKIFRKGSKMDNLRDLRKYLKMEGFSRSERDALYREVRNEITGNPTVREKRDKDGKLVGQAMAHSLDVRDLVQKKVKSEELLKAEQIVAKGQATAQSQTNAVDTNADTSAVTVAAAGAQIEASSIGNQAIVNAIGEGNQVLANILSQIQGEFAKLPGYEG